MKIIDIWLRGRFGYALPALKIALGNLSTMMILNIVDPTILQHQLTFPEAMTYAHVLAYLTGFSGLILSAYYCGEFWINLGSWIIKRLTNEATG